MKGQEKNIELAQYWINKLTDNWKDELSLSDEYKKYYIPLKSFLINQLGVYKEPKLEDKIALEFEIPRKYYNKDYKKIVKENFKNLFKIVESFEPVHESDGTYVALKKFRYPIAGLSFVKSVTDNYKIIDEVPSPKTFAADYIEQTTDYSPVAIQTEYPQFFSTHWLNDMEQFLSAITPKPISTHIENLLDKINEDNLNDVIPKEKQIKLKDTSEGMRNKYGYFYQDWKNLTKQQQVEILAEMARKDLVNTPSHWWNNFKTEFPEGYSVELSRYKNKIKRKNRHQQFKINGLIFYKGKE